MRRLSGLLLQRGAAAGAMHASCCSCSSSSRRGLLLLGRCTPAAARASSSGSGTGAAAVATAAAAAAAAAPTTTTAGSSSRSRAFPDEPRVGVGVVVFRRPLAGPGDDRDPEVLLVKRAKEPAKGEWCFPGGSLELGETLAQCAAREVLEETGVRLLVAAADGGDGGDGAAAADDAEGFSRTLRVPTPFAAVDSIMWAQEQQPKQEQEQGQGRQGQQGQQPQPPPPPSPPPRLKYHYVVVECAAFAADPDAVPVAGDDVDAAQWLRVSALRDLGPALTKHCARLAEEACARFDLSQAGVAGATPGAQ